MWTLVSLFLLQPAAAEAPQAERPAYECVRLDLSERARWRCRFEETELLCDARIRGRERLSLSCNADERRLRRQRPSSDVLAERTISALACPARPQWERTPWLCRADEIEVRCNFDRVGGDEQLTCATAGFRRNEHREAQERVRQSGDIPRR